MKPKIRNLSFDFRDVPRHWYDGKRSITSFCDSVSLFFPAAERFIIASMRANRDRARNAEQATLVRLFNGQETLHAREHDRYNQLLQKQGYSATEMDVRCSRLFEYVTRYMSPLTRLGIACSFEHFTSVMSEVVLSQPGMFDDAHPSMAALWRWHSLEELEHKAVVFELYDAADGGYIRRIATMIVGAHIFWGKILEHQLRLMAADGIALSFAEWRALGRFLFVEPGGMQRIFVPCLKYFLPGYRPSMTETRDLVETWRRTFENPLNGAASPATAKIS